MKNNKEIELRAEVSPKELDDIENEVLLGNGKKAKTLNEYNADELIKDNFLNDI